MGIRLENLNKAISEKLNFRDLNPDFFYIAEKLYVPKEYVTSAHLDEFTYFYMVEVELSDSTVEKVKQDVYLYTEVNDHYAFHRGDIIKLIRLWPQLNDANNVIDLRNSGKFDFDLKFNPDFQYKTYSTGSQEIELKRFLTPNVGGVWCSFPAFGKTVAGAAITLSLKYNTLVLAHKSDLPGQFLDTFRKFTNITDLEEKHEEKYMYRLHKKKPLPAIGVSTLQYLISNPEMAIECSNFYSLIIMDECHHIGADTFTSIFSTLNPMIRVSFTATLLRTDGLDVIFNDVLGPIRVNVEAPEHKVTGKIIQTDIKIPTKYEYSPYPMNLVYSCVAKSEDRNKLIADNAIQDYLDGYVVLILVKRKIQLENIYNEIIDQLEEKTGLIDCQVERLYSIDKESVRNKVKDRLMKGESYFLITTEQLFGEGSNYPVLSSLHFTFPVANEKTLKQLMGRITREHEGKKDPVLRYYQDKGLGRVIGIGKGWVNQMRKLKVVIRDNFKEEVINLNL